MAFTVLVCLCVRGTAGLVVGCGICDYVVGFDLGFG